MAKWAKERFERNPGRISWSLGWCNKVEVGIPCIHGGRGVNNILDPDAGGNGRGTADTV